ncbi:DUF4247 domain-containing protein [Gordonia rhizosphera]|uniref:DUF4247 domain-containing protein n=1 Tax=Gordonia rhizosphera NBRC 16068 TaxID=1108045 RepID=K6W5J9_9ACTN|nr:DUF4247 domain-containing protein [Gordonia rhizosphera]GAB88981.1 hypothetical protein GORHZ_046_01330 [Gordonia rhizosphera NBRC 16068]
MSYPPPPPPPPGGYGPPAGFGPDEDPRRGLRRTRNIIIGVIVVIALLAIVGSCSVTAIRGMTGDNANARNYITSHYQRDPSLDDGDVDAYVAQGTPTTVAAELSDVQRPTDQRSGDTSNPQNAAGTQFLQYPDYLVGLFPLTAATTQVMLSRDYESGYRHYRPYVGGFWVPTPSYGGSGSSYRGGGSGGGGK